ncbi:MAG: hypothetical protein EXR54_00255 [Dehalococcoidia bacterium]|nr:hypothetical protein [Dehalococcoidia bacterium]MSQ15993.1 hypothetical protein [Dehalococcoidia bacterium]
MGSIPIARSTGCPQLQLPGPRRQPPEGRFPDRTALQGDRQLPAASLAERVVPAEFRRQRGHRCGLLLLRLESHPRFMRGIQVAADFRGQQLRLHRAALHPGNGFQVPFQVAAAEVHHLTVAALHVTGAAEPGFQLVLVQIVPHRLVFRVRMSQVKDELDTEHEQLGGLYFDEQEPTAQRRAGSCPRWLG